MVASLILVLGRLLQAKGAAHTIAVALYIAYRWPLVFLMRTIRDLFLCSMCVIGCHPPAMFSYELTY